MTKATQEWFLAYHPAPDLCDSSHQKGSGVLIENWQDDPQKRAMRDSVRAFFSVKRG